MQKASAQRQSGAHQRDWTGRSLADAAGSAGVSADKFQGELVSKDVTLNAQVRKDNQTTQKTLV